MNREDKGTEQVDWETQDESKRKNLDTARARAIVENVDAVVGMVVERGDREAIQETLKARLEEARKGKSEKDVVALAMALGSLQQLRLGSREREEAGARGAIGDIRGLYNIARRTPTKSQEVELLSMGVEALPKHEGQLREEIEEEISRGCEEIIKRGVPEDERMELAGAVYPVNAELGLRILRTGHKAGKSAIRVETALTRIRTRKGIEKLREMLLEGEVAPKGEEREEDDEEKLARMLEHGAAALGGKEWETGQTTAGSNRRHRSTGKVTSNMGGTKLDKQKSSRHSARSGGRRRRGQSIRRRWKFLPRGKFGSAQRREC